MFSAISTSTTITAAPVSPVSAAAPVAPVAAVSPVAASSSSTGNAASGGGFGGGQTTQFTLSGASPGEGADETASPTTARPGAAKAAMARIPVTLDAQLMQIENKLADCVNCPSAKTLAGQSQIDALSSQIRQIRQRMLGGGADSAYGVVPPPIGLNVDTCV